MKKLPTLEIDHCVSFAFHSKAHRWRFFASTDKTLKTELKFCPWMQKKESWASAKKIESTEAWFKIKNFFGLGDMKKCGHCFWSKFDLILIKFWSDFGLVLIWFWSDFGLILIRIWSDFGQILAWFWSEFGLIWAKIWPVLAWFLFDLGRFWSDFCLILTRIWSWFEPNLAYFWPDLDLNLAYFW